MLLCCAFFEALVTTRDRLTPVEEGKHVFGDEFSPADIAVAPYFGLTLLVQLENDLGNFGNEEAKMAGGFRWAPKYEQGRAGNLL